MKWFLHGAIGLVMIAGAGCATAGPPHPQMSQAECCAYSEQYAPAHETPAYRAYDHGRSDCCEGTPPRREYYQPPVSAERSDSCCQGDSRVEDRYSPMPTSRDQGRGEFRVHSYGGAEQHYGDCLDRRTGQACDCDDAFDSDYVVERSGYYRDDSRAGYGSSAMQMNPGFFYEAGGVGPIPMGGYGGGGGYAVISGGSGGGSSFASSNASASAYSSSSTSINIGGFGGGMGGHGGYGGGMGGHGDMGGHGGGTGEYGHSGMGGKGSMGGHSGMGGGKH